MEFVSKAVSAIAAIGGMFAGLLCIYGGIELFFVRAVADGNIFCAIANKAGICFIGLGIFMGCVSAFAACHQAIGVAK